MGAVRNVAIIGAGPSGLVSAKSAQEYDLKTTVFESKPDLGGLWIPGQGPSWENMCTNLSKHTCCFSDHPLDSEVADFPSVKQMHEYLRSYAERYDLSDSISFGTRVQTLKREGDHWKISFEDSSQKLREREFDAVVVASGFFSKGTTPQIPGYQDFKGEILHSSQYESASRFERKNVIVVGNGLSGVEICSDLTRAANSVTHLVRRPSWVLPRYLPDPNAQARIPLDLVFYRRPQESTADTAAPEPSPAQANLNRNRYFASFSSQNELLHPACTIDPNSTDFHPVTISDDYLRLVDLGRIRVGVIEGIDRFTVDGLQIEDERFVCADAVIFASGYRFELPFIEDNLKSALQYSPEDQLQPTILYKSMLLRDYPTLAFVGTYKGPFFGIMEAQARFASKLFSGEAPWIDSQEYAQGIEEAEEIRERRPRPQFPHTDYVGFADGLARLNGTFPALDPNDRFYNMVTAGPVVPAHYRMCGPHANRDMSEQILTDIYESYFANEENE